MLTGNILCLLFGFLLLCSSFLRLSFSFFPLSQSCKWICLIHPGLPLFDIFPFQGLEFTFPQVSISRRQHHVDITHTTNSKKSIGGCKMSSFESCWFHSQVLM